MRTIALVPLLFTLRSVTAATCYQYGYGYYECSGGLSYGARIGIGIGVAVGVLLLVSLCSYWRRRADDCNLKRAYAHFRPPAQGSDNPYANNPPPPQNYSAYQSNPYGNNPPPPAQSYYPGQSQYGNGNAFQTYKGAQDGQQPHNTGASGATGITGLTGVQTGATAAGAADHEHGYEWEQARENERLERERAGAGAEVPPPGYDVATTHATDSTGQYAPPPGPPPGKRAGEGAV
ncbi:hypothetical protein Q5752_006234 [Cryptotrichosporon argae]